jgi:hypothetical protein
MLGGLLWFAWIEGAATILPQRDPSHTLQAFIFAYCEMSRRLMSIRAGSWNCLPEIGNRFKSSTSDFPTPKESQILAPGRRSGLAAIRHPPRRSARHTRLVVFEPGRAHSHDLSEPHLGQSQESFPARIVKEL